MAVNRLNKQEAEELRTALLLDCEILLELYKDSYTVEGVLSGEAQHRANAEHLKKVLLENSSKKIVIDWMRTMLNNNFYFTDENNQFVFTNTHAKRSDIQLR
jgi:hypothetical protein